MTQEQKELIIEAVELAVSGVIDKHELITKLETVAQERFEESVG